jgi:hypothetical protein
MRYLSLFIIAILIAACAPQDRPTITLYLAVKRGDLDQIERHIQWDTDINAPIQDGQTALHMAAAMGKPSIVRLLVKKGAQIEAKDNGGQTALYRALQHSRIGIAKLIIKSGGQLQPDQTLFSLIADKVGDRDVIRFLVDQGADIDGLNPEGETPLTFAIRHDQLQPTKQLIRAGADINKPNSHKQSPLALATARNNQDIIRFIKRQGAVME